MSLKVYYIDDEPELLEIFMDNFSTKEISISTFYDPQLAISKISIDPPDLLFIDYNLKNINGDQIALRLDPKIRKVLMTGNSLITCEAHFDKIIEKPLDPEVIVTYLELCLEQKRSN